LPIWIVLALCEVPLVLHQYGLNPAAYYRAGAFAGASLLIVFILRFVAQRQALPLATAIANALSRARRWHDACLQKSEARCQQEIAAAKQNYSDTVQAADQRLKQTLAQAGDRRVACRMASDEKAVRAAGRNEQQLRAKLHQLEAKNAEGLLQLKSATAVRLKALTDASGEREKKFTADYQAQWQALEAEWKSTLQPLFAAITSTRTMANKLFPPWTASGWETWKAPLEFAQAAQFGQLEVEVGKLCGALPKDPRLALPGPAQFTLPLALVYPGQGSILFESAAAGHDVAIGALNDIILRLLSVSPPGRLNFTIIDPVGLGQNFAGVMHLADYEEQIINSRIWTQSGQIEQKLASLNEHMEKVIQMYLRNEYQTIAEYNEQAGVIAEKYHFLVVADFPSGFSDTAAKRLLSIASSGARCGVYTLIHWDHRQPLPQDFLPDDLRKSSVNVTSKGSTLLLTGGPASGADLVIEAPPDAEWATAFIHNVGKQSRDSSRVEVPFAHVAPPDAEIWSEETTTELRVPIGRTGATKLQYLAIGRGTCQHGLIAGKTGSGKSTLFHVMITNLALWCSPEQVEFYLVDFKKGVEFKCYASMRLPHARVVAIESDREFGLSVLQRLDDELKRRGDLFRNLGVQDIAGYKRVGGKEPIPRSLLMVDEFQEFFVEDDTIAQTASLLLDRIVRQGRAFGIHVLLGSQTLGGAYTVARTTLGQMVIRIALQCNEADAYLIMDDTNPAPRLLSRPGEGIYNDTAGTVEGNSPFQTVWLPDEVRESYLEKVRARADQDGKAYPGPIVFEGNAPADVRENLLLRGLLEAESIQRPAAARLWLGAPNSIKGPTEAIFHRQSGNNLLVVGQREEATLAILGVGLVALAAQYPLGAARIVLCDGTSPGTPQREFLDKIIAAIPHPITLAKPGDLPEILNGLAAEMKSRSEDPQAEAAPPAFLVIHGLQKHTKLRYEEDFSFSAGDAGAAPNPAVLLNNLITEGARLGFHVIATCDTYNNVNRFLSRKALSEFEMRVLFQMSANDSASLIDSPKAGNLGLHRALFFNSQEGHLETFRPYALPTTEWINQAAQSLSRLMK
jgi:DNA segregation ATPase FtsK/SpoIIIE-like protein